MCIAGGHPNDDQVVRALSTETAVGSPFLARRSNLATSGACKIRLPDRLVLGSYVKPMEWARPLVDMLDLGSNAARSIIGRWNPFNKRDSFV